MKRFLTLLTASSMIFGSVAANAASGVAVFNGTVLSTCAVTVSAPGLLDINSDGTVLSTSGGLGTPATALVVTTGSTFRVGVATPSSFTAYPPGGNSGVTFQTQYSTTGATSVSGILSGVTSLLNVGTTNLSINLSATKTSIFPAGNYTAQTTITCE